MKEEEYQSSSVESLEAKKQIFSLSPASAILWLIAVQIFFFFSEGLKQQTSQNKETMVKKNRKLSLFE